MTLQKNPSSTTTHISMNSHPSKHSPQHPTVRKPCIYVLPTYHQVYHPPMSVYLPTTHAATIHLAPQPMLLLQQCGLPTPRALSNAHQWWCQCSIGHAKFVSTLQTNSPKARASLPPYTIGWKAAIGLQTVGKALVRMWRQCPLVYSLVGCTKVAGSRSTNY